MRKKLTKAQKAHNRAEYNRIRRAWEGTDKSITYKQFKARVLNRAVGTNISIKEAAKKEANTRTFKSASDIGKENILKGLKEEFRATYDELRRKAGRFSKGERLIDKLTWDDTKQSWVLTSSNGDQYLVDITNSPKAAYLIKI